MNSSREIRRFRKRMANASIQDRSGDSAISDADISDAVIRVPVGGVFRGWQHGFHDKRIRTVDQRDHALRYVQENAFRHGLVSRSEDWPWTSLHFRHLIDETEPW